MLKQKTVFYIAYKFHLLIRDYKIGIQEILFIGDYKTFLFVRIRTIIFNIFVSAQAK